MTVFHFITIALYILSLLANITVIGFLLYHDQNNKSYRPFAYSFVCIIVWQLLIGTGIFFHISAIDAFNFPTHTFFIVIDRLQYLLFALVFIFLWRAIHSLFYAYSRSFIIFLWCVAAYFVASVCIDTVSTTEFFSRSRVFIPFVGMMAIVSVGVIIQSLLLLTAIRNERSQKQMLLLSVGTIPLIITIFIFFFFAPAIFGIIGLEFGQVAKFFYRPFHGFYALWFSIFASVYTAVIVYSIVKHSLFDVRIVFRKTTIRIIIYSATALVYLAVFVPLVWSIQIWSVWSLMAYAIFFVFSVLLIDFLLQRFMQQYLHSRFYYGITMQPSEQRLLERSTQVETIVRQLVGDLYKILPVDACTFYTRQNDVKGLILKYSTTPGAQYFFPSQFVPELFDEEQWRCVPDYLQTNEQAVRSASKPLAAYLDSLDCVIAIPLLHVNDYPVGVLCIGRQLNGKHLLEMDEEMYAVLRKFTAYASSQLWGAMSLENTVVIALRNRITQNEYII